MQLKTANSSIEEYLAFDYSSFQSFKDFIDDVYIRTHLTNTHIGVEDLAYFSYSLKPYEANQLEFSGEAKGYVSNFNVDDFELNAGKSSVVKGDLDLKGLPDWRSSFIDLKIQELSSTPKEVEDIMKLSLQTKLHQFGHFDFTGHLTGFYTDFAADGILTSDLGQLTSRINFKLLQNEYADYTGRLVAENFDIGRFP